MKNSSNSQQNPLNNRRRKDSSLEAQMKVVYNSFYEQPKTMLMVSIETGILRANICRYVAKWRKFSRIEPVKTDYCQITNHLANYLTTNPEQFQNTDQLKMF